MTITDFWSGYPWHSSYSDVMYKGPQSCCFGSENENKNNLKHMLSMHMPGMAIFMYSVFEYNWNLKLYRLGVCGGRKSEKLAKKKPFEQEREPTTNSAHEWCWTQNSNPGHPGKKW